VVSLAHIIIGVRSRPFVFDFSFSPAYFDDSVIFVHLFLHNEESGEQTDGGTVEYLVGALRIDGEIGVTAAAATTPRNGHRPYRFSKGKSKNEGMHGTTRE
jgi:hypothetical protein